jgi:tetratricopeptide (TPR) repeat protein
MVAAAMLLTGLSILAASLAGSKSDSVVGRPIDTPASIVAESSGTTTGYADRTIQAAQARISQAPGDYRAFGELGFAFQQKARETNDPAFYTQAEDALNRALTLKPDYYEALGGMGQLNLSRHEFGIALEWGRKAQSVQPYAAYAYGVMGDAQIELGQYEQAVQNFQQMVNIRPDLSSYSRVSYARELYGDVAGAVEAMQQAVNAGGPSAENTAWCRVQLGNLFFNSGNLAQAEQAYDAALAEFPNYLHAQAGLAMVRWAQGRRDDAVTLMKAAVSTVPLPQYLTVLGDLLADSDDSVGAQEQYNLVLYIFQVFESGGVNVNIEKAAFLADHQGGAQAVAHAEAAAKTRNDIHTMDTLAWAYYKAGRYQDALVSEQSAMRLGTRNALLYFHLGMIQDKMGDKANAIKSIQKALQINPYFSVQYSKEAHQFVRK